MSETQVGANSDTVASASGTLELVRRAAQDGATDARKAAARTWDATSLFVSRFVYTTCYTVSYGVVFPAVLLAHSIPRNNVAVRGLIDGAQAAKHQVDQIRGASVGSSNATAAPAPAPV
jgi:hypothetical protein